MIRQFRYIATLLYSVFACSVPALADSAAEVDWRISSNPGQCQGQYVDGSINPSTNEHSDSALPIRASAGSALHVEDHSTTLTGDVYVSHGSQQLRGDFFTMDAQTESYTVEGNAQLRQKGLLVKGARVEGNFYNDIAAIDSASFLLHDSHLRGTAATLTKDEQETLTITEGEFTTCEPDSNTWAIQGKEIELIKAEGYGVARHVTLRIKDVPIAYSPYFRFPIDDSRQSGFLWPAMGHDSDGGTDVAVPYYFNLKPNLDATYTLRSIWKRGVMHEGELRYRNNYGETCSPEHSCLPMMSMMIVIESQQRTFRGSTSKIDGLDTSATKVDPARGPLRLTIPASQTSIISMISVDSQTPTLILTIPWRPQVTLRC